MADTGRNNAKAKLAAGEVVTALAGVDDPEWIDFVGQTGVEAIWLEAEHGPVDFSHVGDLSRACDLWGMCPIVRVGRAEANVIYRTLDRGAQGIIVPHVDTREDAELVVDAAKFAPIGHRGMWFSRRSYGKSGYFESANDETMIVVLIEDIRAVNNLDEILKVDHIDVFHVAYGDLGQSMGHIADLNHPEVQKTVDDTIARIVAAGRTAGTTCTGSIGKHIATGARFFYANVKEWILEGANRHRAGIQAATGEG